MKSNKEILLLLKKNRQQFTSGLCALLYNLETLRIITEKEHCKFTRYMIRNQPKGRYGCDSYWWKPYYWSFRLEWINKQIKKLSK